MLPHNGLIDVDPEGSRTSCQQDLARVPKPNYQGDKMKQVIVKLMCAAYLAILAGGAFAQRVVEVLPATPNSSDTILIRMQFAPYPLFNGDSYRVEMEANRIRLIYAPIDGSGIVPLPLPFYAEVGKLPAGTYAVDAYSTDKTTGALTLIGSSSSFTVTSGRIGKKSPFVNFNVADHWWKPSESGWGLFIWHDRLDNLLAAWFTYGADNKPLWYTIQGGAWKSTYIYEGSIYQSTGPAFSAFMPGSVVQTLPIGTARLHFGLDIADFTYTLNGVTQTKQIVRFKP